MNYRRLHREELEAIKDEFIRFLASNSVTADDWVRLKQADPADAESLVDVFSDIFWEKALTKIPAVEVRSKNMLRILRFNDDMAELVEIRLPEDVNIDLTNTKDLNALSSGEIDILTLNPSLFVGTQKYQNGRNQELFAMIESGAQPCKESMFMALKAMVKNQ
jgi:hypothetical protein